MTAAVRTVRYAASLSSFGPVRFDPPLADWPAAGVYQLHLRVAEAADVIVGRLGRFCFPPGSYVYVGRASRGLTARVRRHVVGGGRRHWHIDYLLAHPGVRVERVVLTSSEPTQECVISQSLARSALCVAPRFGASDCRQGCPAHLWYCGP